MGRYADLTFMREAEVPPPGDALVFRESRFVHVTFFVAMALLAAFFLVLPTDIFGLVTLPAFPEVFRYLSGIPLALIALIVLSGARASLSRSNWLLQATPEALTIKFRSFRNRHFSAADEIVVRIPKREIAWLRCHGRKTFRPARGADGGDSWTGRKMLEIKLHGDDTEELAQRLHQERQRFGPTKIGGPGSRTRANHFPVRLRSPGLIEIDWAGHDTAMRPRIGRTLRLLSRWYEVAADYDDAEAHPDDLTPAQQESQLVDMVQRGETMSAVILAKRLYGYDTTRAKAFVDDLAGR